VAAAPEGAVLKAQLRLWLREEIAMGPGKADLLDAIAEAGSIAAAGRRLNMSYRRAWLLVDTMNRCFRQPLVASATGGQGGGGAQLTDTGRQVLASYRAMQAEADQLSERWFLRLSQHLRD